MPGKPGRPRTRQAPPPRDVIISVTVLEERLDLLLEQRVDSTVVARVLSALLPELFGRDEVSPVGDTSSFSTPGGGRRAGKPNMLLLDGVVSPDRSEVPRSQRTAQDKHDYPDPRIGS
jgi:hypothetical protein